MIFRQTDLRYILTVGNDNTELILTLGQSKIVTTSPTIILLYIPILVCVIRMVHLGQYHIAGNFSPSVVFKLKKKKLYSNRMNN